ncbi:unnamed protein product [Nippostrongylus brasiliensis]|uniref:Reverse transcriptase domain-containing protein n=1 Tax=Nippostrongylus brasiliensis TaxID=27835 RepID=A0A0N4Y4G0_NIPBR|nr:unnamed protein product [Nippostrongylus brasiliensis]
MVLLRNELNFGNVFSESVEGGYEILAVDVFSPYGTLRILSDLTEGDRLFLMLGDFNMPEVQGVHINGWNLLIIGCLCSKDAYVAQEKTLSHEANSRAEHGNTTFDMYL